MKNRVPAADFNVHQTALGIAVAITAATTAVGPVVLGALTGVIVGALVLVICRTRPSATELLIDAVALAAVIALAAVLRDWPDFKDGIVDGFRRAWPF